jgi:hypothetical protein
MDRKFNKKQALLEAFNKSESKQAAEACRIAGVSTATYNFHRYKDENFRRKVLEIQRDYLTARIEAS